MDGEEKVHFQERENSRVRFAKLLKMGNSSNRETGPFAGTNLQRGWWVVGEGALVGRRDLRECCALEGRWRFRLHSRLYDHTNVMITTVLRCSEWSSVFGHAKATTAPLDRLTDLCLILEIWAPPLL
jgi:hypothetical protein